MMEYRILFGFVRGRRGDVISVTPDDAATLLASGLIAPVETQAQQTEPPAPLTEAEQDANLATFAKGGGWYEFPSVEGTDPLKVQGREAALAELAKRGS